MQADNTELNEYEKQKQVKALFVRLLRALILHRPDNPADFVLECLEQNEIPDQVPPLVTKPFIVN